MPVVLSLLDPERVYVGTTVDISGFPKHGHAHNTDVMSPNGRAWAKKMSAQYRTPQETPNLKF